MKILLEIKLFIKLANNIILYLRCNAAFFLLKLPPAPASTNECTGGSVNVCLLC